MPSSVAEQAMRLAGGCPDYVKDTATAGERLR
jgi:hypothetical protein